MNMAVATNVDSYITMYVFTYILRLGRLPSVERTETLITAPQDARGGDQE